ncbi:hypothetical protein Cgig2_004607 [Carnegiea gigantea]|uniref:Uncharacterized protein n=1 Tax=Carnegiea gigantea TaxID=171969 RepID=A0A9Q1JZU2_9CARY|nr:hypothetical protein Cgig2_004607 [Carnegiea gigantea]
MNAGSKKLRKNVYTYLTEPSQPIILENDEEYESSDDDGNDGEEDIEAYNFQNNPYLQSALMNEETFMVQSIEDINISTQDTITQGLSGRQPTSQSGKGSTWQTKGKEKVVSNNNSVQMKHQRRQSRGSASKCWPERPNRGTTQQSTTNIATSIQIIRSMIENGNLLKANARWPPPESSTLSVDLPKVGVLSVAPDASTQHALAQPPSLHNECPLCSADGRPHQAYLAPPCGNYYALQQISDRSSFVAGKGIAEVPTSIPGILTREEPSSIAGTKGSTGFPE